MNIKKIRDKIENSEYRFSDHATRRMIERSITRSEVEEAIMRGEILEEYPYDKYSPSCLILGKTKNEKTLHLQVSLPPKVVVVTLYEPDPDEWIDYRIRR